MATAKQLAARKKFAAMVKSKGKSSKSKMDKTPDKTESKKRKLAEKKMGMKS